MNPQSAGQVNDKGVGISKSAFSPMSRPTLMQDMINSKDKSKTSNMEKPTTKLAGQPKRSNLKDLSKLPDSMIGVANDKSNIKRSETIQTIRKPAPMPKKSIPSDRYMIYHSSTPMEKKPSIIESFIDPDAQMKILTNWMRMQQSDPGFAGLMNRHLNIQKGQRTGILTFNSGDYHIAKFLKKYIDVYPGLTGW